MAGMGEKATFKADPAWVEFKEQLGERAVKQASLLYCHTNNGEQSIINLK
jgi:hypothetical protein